MDMTSLTISINTASRLHGPRQFKAPSRQQRTAWVLRVLKSVGEHDLSSVVVRHGDDLCSSKYSTYLRAVLHGVKRGGTLRIQLVRSFEL